MEHLRSQGENTETATQFAMERCITAESQGVQAQISTETEKIIKIHVHQSAMHWELSFKKNELEGLTERQRQNLVELQMQYESLDDEYQHVKKNREDIMHKTQFYKEIGGRFESLHDQYNEKMARFKENKDKLVEFYQNAGEKVGEAKKQMMDIEDRQKSEVEQLKQQIQTEKSHNEALIEISKDMANMHDQQYEDLKKKYSSEEKEYSVLMAELNAAHNEYMVHTGDKDEKDKIIEQLREELRKGMEALSVQNKELVEWDGALENARKTFNEKDAYAKTLLEQNKVLEMKLTELSNTYEDTKMKTNNKKNEMKVKMSENRELKELIESKDKALQLSETELSAALNRLDVVTAEQSQKKFSNLQKLNALQAKNNEFLNNLDVDQRSLTEIEATNNELKIALEKSEAAFLALKEEYLQINNENENTINDLSKQLQQSKDELDKVSSLSTSLMAEVQEKLKTKAELEMKDAEKQKSISAFKFNDETLLERLDVLEASLLQRDEDVERVSAKHREADGEVINCKIRINKITAELQSTKKDIDNLKKSILKDELAKKKKELTSQTELFNPRAERKNINEHRAKILHEQGKSQSGRLTPAQQKRKTIQENEVSNASELNGSKKRRALHQEAELDVTVEGKQTAVMDT